jgi:hypothetical protein
MRETRRSLKAENAELKSKLAVHDHATRRSLNDYLKGVVARNEDLAKTCHKQAEKITALEAELVLAKAEPEQAAA